MPRLREAGIRHVAIVTGDKAAVAQAVGERLGVDRVYAEQTPDQKLDVVRALQAHPELRSIVMVGDGINDAPALALADVGVAMGSGGATVSSETADAVVLVDRVDRVADAISFSRRALYIAHQSVLLGIGASLVAMGFAALRLPPARRRRPAPGRDRRRRDPERPARVEGLRPILCLGHCDHSPRPSRPRATFESTVWPVKALTDWDFVVRRIAIGSCPDAPVGVTGEPGTRRWLLCKSLREGRQSPSRASWRLS